MKTMQSNKKRTWITDIREDDSFKTILRLTSNDDGKLTRGSFYGTAESRNKKSGEVGVYLFEPIVEESSK